jgi:hypothetical protein
MMRCSCGSVEATWAAPSCPRRVREDCDQSHTLRDDEQTDDQHEKPVAELFMA